MIVAKDLTKVYRMGEVEVHALRGVSLQINKGEFLAAMGPSGAGKSTFMNILGCLDNPTSGVYLLEGREVSRLNRDELAVIRNDKIGFVFQNFNLLPRVTALGNVELPLLYKGVPHRIRMNKAEEVLHSVGLKNRERYPPGKLSGGEQQRVAIARAIINNPSLILADEPTGNLDSKNAADIMNIFVELNKRGITIILVTHETDIAAYAHRKIIFKDGLIVEDTSTARRKATKSSSSSSSSRV
ncbi:MAG: ABC transporter ATP-binding protein [Candidatus Brocadiales bacterium]|nr:ABC transporter ATP-binding protein [Candidatus Bathyanammoxibius sp.]